MNILRNKSEYRFAFLCAILLVSVGQPIVAEELDFDLIRQFPIQDQGRVKPLDTLARETLKTLYGRESLSWQDSGKGLNRAPSGDPVDGLLSLMFQSDQWSHLPFVRIKSGRFRDALGLPPDRNYFSPDELLKNPALLQYYHAAIGRRRAGEEHLPDFEEKSLVVMNSLHLYQWLDRGRSLPMIPPNEEEGKNWEELTWLSLGEIEKAASEHSKTLLPEWDRIESAYLSRDKKLFQSTILSLSDKISVMAPEGTYRPGMINLEIHYNRLKPFYWTLLLYLIAFMIWMLSIGFDQSRLLVWGSIALTSAGFAVQTYGFFLRTLVSGRAPVTNMYESMLFMAWGLILFALLFETIYRSKYFGLSATLASGIIALSAQILPIDSGIGVLVPVLRSNFWLVIHVLTTMLSYSAFTMAWGLGHIVLIRVMIHPDQLPRMTSLCNFVYRTLQVGVFFLAVGTILGGVWANYAWGRFWGWDPKETWSLICLLGYLAVLHARHTRWIGNFGMALWSVIAFLLVVMCYYGVNFILPVGLHGYGSGSGGVLYAIIYVSLDSLLIGGALWRWNRLGRSKAAQDCNPPDPPPQS